MSVVFFPTTDSEELAASILQVIPQAYCAEHVLGPHGQVTVSVCVALWEGRRTDPCLAGPDEPLYDTD